jgi:hypothetical protein
MLAWLQENPKQDDWIQPVSDKDDICAEDARHCIEAHPELRDHPHFHKSTGEPRESWFQLESSAQWTKTRTEDSRIYQVNGLFFR